ncbi:hypothetical protein Syun_020516 [Stephania yunnanensis]|uniref:(S)-ureidoglycine aminohydrolase cupin domain-containing protein n=1 Tax=Stephania yunnanensis TaxID=152371 RepID=A0AAP0IDZ4_9MAGN
MATAVLSFGYSLSSPVLNSIHCRDSHDRSRHSKSSMICSRWKKPLEELYNVKVERNVSPKRLEELGVSRWSTWKTGKCQFGWDWHVDQLVYIMEGEVRVVPEGSELFMRFVAGDLVRYPKWFEANLFFNAPYEERYSFRAYGDD